MQLNSWLFHFCLNFTVCQTLSHHPYLLFYVLPFLWSFSLSFTSTLYCSCMPGPVLSPLPVIRTAYVFSSCPPTLCGLSCLTPSSNPLTCFTSCYRRHMLPLRTVCGQVSVRISSVTIFRRRRAWKKDEREWTRRGEFTHVALSLLIINVSQVCKIASRSSRSIFPSSLLPLAFLSLVHSVFFFLFPRGLSPLSVSMFP